MRSSSGGGVFSVRRRESPQSASAERGWRNFAEDYRGGKRGSARRLTPIWQARDRATFNSGARRAPDVSRIKAVAAWVAIIGGGIAFYFFYGVAAEWMR